mmetsp:Transcript_14460/g.43434  ORF Transcript_14460/g.43434 Transcript_14460/m.43434 type:complete len:292 (-) Transcript_14460:612-1487(-)
MATTTTTRRSATLGRLQARLVRGDEPLDVCVGVWPARLLQELQRLRRHGADVCDALSLLVVHAIPKVLAVAVVPLEGGQELPVVRHDRLSHARVAGHQLLQDHQHRDEHVLVVGHDGVPQGDDDRLQVRQHPLGVAPGCVQQLQHALAREEPVRVPLAPDALEEDGQVVLVVERLQRADPAQAIAVRSMLQRGRELTPRVAPHEQRLRQLHVHALGLGRLAVRALPAHGFPLQPQLRSAHRVPLADAIHVPAREDRRRRHGVHGKAGRRLGLHAVEIAESRRLAGLLAALQ